MLIPAPINSEISGLLSTVGGLLDVSTFSFHDAQANIPSARDAYVKFEEIRFDYMARTALLLEKSVGSAADVLGSLKSNIDQLLSDSAFVEFVSGRTVKTGNYPPGTTIGTVVPKEIYASKETEVGELLKLFSKGLGEIRNSLKYQSLVYQTDSREDLSKSIRELVPDRQNIGPLYFQVRSGKLALLPVFDSAYEDCEEVAVQARAQLITSGERIIEQFNSSNFDPRLLKVISELQDRLVSEDGVVRLGLSNLACEVMIDSLRAELPDAFSAMLQAQVIGIRMYVAQYPEWRKFTEQAVQIEMSVEHAPALSHAISQLTDKLESIPDVVDPEVPRTLRALLALIADPRATSKRALFAVWRSVENFAIVVFNYCAEFIELTSQEIKNRGSRLAGKAIAFTLLFGVLAGATELVPLATLVPEASWLPRVVELVK